MMNNLPDFKRFCEDACVKLWGEPTKRTKKELRWNGGDSYGYRTFDLRKRVWYDADQQRGGSTLELVAYAKGKPAEPLRGAAFFEAWRFAYDARSSSGGVPTRPSRYRIVCAQPGSS
jgi:hypothetical protein